MPTEYHPLRQGIVSGKVVRAETIARARQPSASIRAPRLRRPANADRERAHDAISSGESAFSNQDAAVLRA
jgi:hypothetical protein